MDRSRGCLNVEKVANFRKTNSYEKTDIWHKSDHRWLLRPYQGNGNDEVHEYFAQLMRDADTLLYGRKNL